MSTIITELRKTNSIIEKKIILMRCGFFDQSMFAYAYDPFKTYGVKFTDIDMSNLGEPRLEMFKLLSKLSSRKVTGNAARYDVEEYASHFGDLIKLICNKDLACGVSATILNSALGENFIPKFKIQLAMEDDIANVSLPILGQIKYNGARVVIIIDNGVVTLKSRGGHPFNFSKLEKLFDKYIENKFMSIVLDGELTFGDSQFTDHTAVSGLVNSAIKGTPICMDGLVYNVFDSMTLEEFNEHKCGSLYVDRLTRVNSVVDYIKSPMLVTAKTWIFNTHADIELEYAKLLEAGYEGLVLKKANSLYKFKRTKDWVKLKATDTADLVCVGYIEGKPGTKYEGSIGALQCMGVVSKKSISVNVGSGLTDNDRSIDPQYYIGKTIEVKYNKVIQDTKTGDWSLFLPRFVIVRSDK